MPVKISSFEIENVKRVRAVSLAPTENGLTVIGGRNGQGKTSVLDAIAWALGGDRFRPSAAQREGSVIPPHLTVRLSNGIVVERKGKNSALKVIDPSITFDNLYFFVLKTTQQKKKQESLYKRSCFL